jgi:hypothetical protein
MHSLSLVSIWCVWLSGLHCIGLRLLYSGKVTFVRHFIEQLVCMLSRCTQPSGAVARGRARAVTHVEKQTSMCSNGRGRVAYTGLGLRDPEQHGDRHQEEARGEEQWLEE